MSMRFLALGDSYTIGEAVNPQERWPLQLVQGLRHRGMAIADPQFLATTGWTTADLRQALATAELAPPYDLVSLQIGVNNQYHGLEHSMYAQDFELLLRQAIELANMRKYRVFVLSIPDWSVTPFAEGRDRTHIAKEIDTYNRINAKLSYTYGVQYLNITPISRQAAKYPQLLTTDGLHPSGEMYRRWVDHFIDRVRRELMDHVVRA